MNMSYTCEDIDKTYAELKKHGVEFEGPPQKQPWGTYAMFKDGEGKSFRSFVGLTAGRAGPENVGTPRQHGAHRSGRPA